MIRRRVWACRTLLKGLAVVVIAAVLPSSPQADDELDYGLDPRRLRRLEFRGADFFDEDRLRSQLGLIGAPWYAPFGDTFYRRDRVEQGIEAIRGSYRRQGFHGVQVQLVEVERDAARGDHLRIEVEEGLRTLIAEVQIVDPEPLDDAAIRAQLRYREGGPAPSRAADLGNDIYRILDTYLARGHLGARVREDFVRGDSTVTVRYKIRSGPTYSVRDVAIDGNQRVIDEFIRREILLKPGQAFDAERIGRTEARLLDTGWFRDVSFEPVGLDTLRAEATLRVRTLERATAFWEFGVGTGSEDRFRFSAAWGDRNVWRSGKGLTLRARVLGAIDRVPLKQDDRDLFFDHEEELLYRHLHVLGTRYTGNVSLFVREESRPGSENLRLRQRGLLLSTALLDRGATTLEVEYGLRRSTKSSLRGDSPYDNDRSVTSSFTMVVTTDTRNDLFSPTRGQLRQVLLETAGGPALAGNNDFNKALVSSVLLQPLPRRAVLALRAQVGWVQAWSTSARKIGPQRGVPLEDRFFAGGSSSVRGYRENSLGPRLNEDDEALEAFDPRFQLDRLSGGGNALLLLNAELRFGLPLISRFGFDGSVFFDSGNVWRSWSALRIHEVRLTGGVSGEEAERAYRTSVGFGLQFRTIVGPVRLDLGFPLRRARFPVRDASGVVASFDRDPPRVWHLSLGHAF